MRDERVRREVLESVCAAVPEAARFSVSLPYDAPGEGGEVGDEGEGEEGAAAAAAASPPASPNNGDGGGGGEQLPPPPPPPRFVLQGTMESPIRGATSGNVEYLAHFKRG